MDPSTRRTLLLVSSHLLWVKVQSRYHLSGTNLSTESTANKLGSLRMKLSSRLELSSTKILLLTPFVSREDFLRWVVSRCSGIRAEGWNNAADSRHSIQRNLVRSSRSIAPLLNLTRKSTSTFTKFLSYLAMRRTVQHWSRNDSNPSIMPSMKR